MTMQTFEIFQETAEHARSSIDEVLKDSAIAQQCMKTEEILLVVDWIFQGLTKWDIRTTDSVLAGDLATDTMPIDKLRKMFEVHIELQKSAIDLAEIFEDDGFVVKHVERIRAVNFDNFAILGVIREFDGTEVAVGSHLQAAIQKCQHGSNLPSIVESESIHFQGLSEPQHLLGCQGFNRRQYECIATDLARISVIKSRAN